MMEANKIVERIGLIDLGSNTARLVIFDVLEGGYFMVADEMLEAVRLGETEIDGSLKQTPGFAGNQHGKGFQKAMRGQQSGQNSRCGYRSRASREKSTHVFKRNVRLYRTEIQGCFRRRGSQSHLSGSNQLDGNSQRADYGNRRRKHEVRLLQPPQHTAHRNFFFRCGDAYGNVCRSRRRARGGGAKNHGIFQAAARNGGMARRA